MTRTIRLMLAGLAAFVAHECIAATSITHDGFTLTWTEDRTTGQYANGDWWVVGPITVTAISPADSDTADTVDKHGAQLNPTDTNQGHDSRGRFYSRALNFARTMGSVSATTSIVLSQSRADDQFADGSNSTDQLEPIPVGGGVADWTNNPYSQRKIVITVVSSAPSSGELRPAAFGASASKVTGLNKSSFNYALLANLTAVSGQPSLAEGAANFSRFWDDRDGFAFSRIHQAVDNGPTYGHDRADDIQTAALALQTSATNAAKEECLVNLVQYGLDIYGAALLGSEWEANGGHGSGRHFPMLLAGLMTGSTAIINAGNASATSLPGTYDNFIFGEDQNCFWVTAGDVGRGSTGYTSGDIGLAEWGIKHFHTPADDRAAWGATYRDVVGSTMIGIILAARCMGIESYWNHPEKNGSNEQAIFSYYDRYYTQEEAQAGTGENEIRNYVKAFWQAYRAGAPYVGADTTPPTLQSATINSAGSTITLAFNEATTRNSGTPTVSLSGGACTLTYSSGSGTTSHVYTLSRTVAYGETGTLSATPGANGWEDAAGNDVATISGFSITNNAAASGGTVTASGRITSATIKVQ